MTSIGVGTFWGCSGLTSVSIPNSVTSIEDGAFNGCSGLVSVTIPNSVTSIGWEAFRGCSSLTSLTIPYSVTSIGNSAFYGCSSVTNIKVFVSDYSSFINNSLLSKIKIDKPTTLLDVDGNEINNFVIPNDITSIGDACFYYCDLSSITIPNSVTFIGESAFEGCRNLTSLTIPESLNIIKRRSFANCRSLESITIPASVEFIYQEAFTKCNSLNQVNALPENPPFLYDNSFSNYNITLCVPEASKDVYMATSPWSKFTTFKTLTGEDVEKKKCAKPTISVENGKLKFSCETEEVDYHYTISNNSPASGLGNDVPFSQNYTITVYATKNGYENSDTATAKITATVGITGDANGDSVVNAADIVKIVNIIMGE